MMEGRRRQKGENPRRSVQSRKPPRGSWQPTVPSWEKHFCKMVGSLDWETLLQMKKFMHLYSNVLNWDDSAGEEAFYNAKKRYWAEINGHACDIPSPDPDLYIDKINWDSETEPEFPQDVESKQYIPNTGDTHDPVVIFGDSLLLNHAYLPVGWGDDEEKNLDVRFNHSCPNYLVVNQAFHPPGWGDYEGKLKVPVNHHSPVNYIDPWDQNWGRPLNNMATPVWPGFSDNAWQFNGAAPGPTPAGYMSWGGTDWNEGNCGWNYANNKCSYTIGDIKDGRGAEGFWDGSNVAPANASGNILSHDEEHGFWNESNIAPAKGNTGGNSLSPGDEHGFWKKSNIAPAKGNTGEKGFGPGTRRGQGKGRYRNHMSWNDNRGQFEQYGGAERRSMLRKWNSMDSCNGGVGHNANAAAIAVGRTCNR